MNGLGDSLTIGVVLTLIFGAGFFYLYSRLSQNEKRVSLLENLLLNLKMSTEASLMGPDMVEATSSPSPLEKTDVDEVNEVDYADMLKGIDTANELVGDSAAAVSQKEEVVSRPTESEPTTSVRKMDANYESLSLKELQALARQRGVTGVSARKRDLVDALKKQGDIAPLAPAPLPVAADELEGAAQTGPFNVEMEQPL